MGCARKPGSATVPWGTPGAPRAAELRRLIGQEHRRERPARVRREERFELREHRRGIHVADHDERQVVGHVAGLVVGHHVVARELVENVEVPDDRVAVRVLAVGRGEKLLAVHPVGIVGEHGELAPDHLLFLDELVGRQVEFMHASASSSMAVAAPARGTSIQYTVRSKEV